MEAYFSTPTSNTDTKTDLTDAEYSRRAKGNVAAEWEAAKKWETARLIQEAKQQKLYENNHILRNNGLDPTTT